MRNYRDLWERVRSPEDRDSAWSAFLPGFYQHRDGESFRYAPPTELARVWCVMYAALAEYLCRRYGLPLPTWTKEPQCFLPERWEVLPGFDQDDFWTPFPFLCSEETWEEVEEEFRRRGLVYEARHLIAT